MLRKLLSVSYCVVTVVAINQTLLNLLNRVIVSGDLSRIATC